MSTLMIAGVAGGLVLALLTSMVVVLVLRLMRALRAVTHLEQQVTRLQEGTNLLTDTVELGFRQCGEELERLSLQQTAARPTAAGAMRDMTERIRAASAQGRSVGEIAAQEDVAEGEVRLRLILGETGGAARTPRPGTARLAARPIARGREHATLRA